MATDEFRLVKRKSKANRRKFAERKCNDVIICHDIVDHDESQLNEFICHCREDLEGSIFLKKLKDLLEQNLLKTCGQVHPNYSSKLQSSLDGELKRKPCVELKPFSNIDGINEQCGKTPGSSDGIQINDLRSGTRQCSDGAKRCIPSSSLQSSNSAGICADVDETLQYRHNCAFKDSGPCIECACKDSRPCIGSHQSDDVMKPHGNIELCDTMGKNGTLHQCEQAEQRVTLSSCGEVDNPDSCKIHNAENNAHTSVTPQCVEYDLVCYGLGSFSTCVIARYQLSLLLILRDLLQVSSRNCFVYDPVHTEIEKRILLKYNCTPMSENEEGLREVMKRTVFFMPHCGKALYNNLLWKNWHPDKLSNISIIGNSFTTMNDSTPRRILQETAVYVMKILPYTTEFRFENSFHHDDIFNDTSLHVFRTPFLPTAGDAFWKQAEKPSYDEDDVEIILNKLHI